ncbi:MAG: hypothetical protein M1308_11270 [Actinobacteria bacterium]|nr:hypothetical protein [Actinomycetota bacterium]
MSNIVKDFTEAALAQGNGVLHLCPTWVPRSFLVPGRRLKLHPDDLYILGTERGGIDERWLASTTKAYNGPLTPDDEGLSYVVHDNQKYTLRDIIKCCGDIILGKDTMEKYGGWKIYAKFFDNMEPIPHHVHQMDEHAKNVGMEGKPEAYYFPVQLNTIKNTFPYTFFGLEPGTTKQDLINCLKNWGRGDNGILDLSKAYRLKPGTGWLLPPGILHAPGTLVTYEVQWASDILSLFQSMVGDKFIDKELLTISVPPERKNDYDYIVSMLDWEKNILPNFREKFYRTPKIVNSNTKSQGYIEKWVVYGKIDNKEYFSAKELTIDPKAKAIISDNGAYGLVVLQGIGKINGVGVSSPTQIRYGELTDDEFFITYQAAQKGVEIENTANEPLVMLKVFGPDTNPDMPEG